MTAESNDVHRLRVRALLVFAILIAAPALLALDASRLPTQYVHRSWRDEQGLPNLAVAAIAQTADGYLWIATAGGLVRFDGVRLTTFDPASEPAIRDRAINALLVRRSGALWIGTGDGIAVYENGRFQALPAKGLPGGNITAMTEDDAGNVWVGVWTGPTVAAVARYGDGAFVVVHGRPGMGRIWALHARGDEIWAGTATGLDRIRGNAVEHYGESLGNIPVYAIGRRSDGAMLLGTIQGLFAIDGARASRVRPELPADAVMAIATDRHGNRWIGTRQGLFRWSGDRTDAMGDIEGLSQDLVRTVFEDREGSLWVGTQYGGLKQLRDGAFVPFTTEEGLSHNSVWSVSEKDGVVFTGTSRGVDRFDGKRWSPMPLPVAANVSVASVFAGNGSEMWVGTIAGAVHFTDAGSRVYDKSSGLPHDTVKVIYRDRADTTWLGTETGLCRLAGDRITTYGTREGVPANVQSMLEDRRGRLWVGTDGGLVIREGERFLGRAGRTELPRKSIYGLYEDSAGALWIGSRDGLYRLIGNELFLFTAEHGLPPGDIGTVVETPRGVLWLATAKGVVRVFRDDLDAVSRGAKAKLDAVILGRSDGMRTADCSYGTLPSLLLARDGRIWFPTIRGVAVLDPRAVGVAFPMSTLIEEVVVDGKPRAGSERITLEPGADTIELHYTAPTFAVPERVRFRYRLEGFDDGWINVGSRRVAYYTKLPPGKYSFRVEAAADDGRWIAAAPGAPIEVTPPFFRTGWFFIVVLLASSSLVWALYAYRIRQLELRHIAVVDERMRIAREIHDTIAQGLTGIGLQLDAALQVLPNIERAREQIVRAKQTAGHSLAEARRSLFRLRSPDFANGDLSAALKHRVEEMTAGSHVHTEVKVTGMLRPLGEEVSTELLRIAQEAIANALRHAAATQIDVCLDIAPSAVRLQVSDNGHGSGPFKLDDLEAMRFGLIGMHERAEKIGGQFMAKSYPGKGTEITVEVPA